MKWQEVGFARSSGIPAGASKFHGGRWWHHQVGTGKLFVHTGLGAGDGSCPSGCYYHEVDGEGGCFTEDMDPCGSAPKSKGGNETKPDCGWAGEPTWTGTQWKCPSPPPGCQPGQVRDAITGQCVGAGVKQGKCASNESYNPVTGKCVPYSKSDDDCNANELIDLVTGKCAPICADGNRRSNGVCPSAPNVQPPQPAPKKEEPKPSPTPPALSAKGAMPWLIGFAVLAGAGTLVYLASKNNPSGSKAPAKFPFKRRRRLLGARRR